MARHRAATRKAALIEAWRMLRGSEPCWIRTSDLLIKSQLLYRLS